MEKLAAIAGKLPYHRGRGKSPVIQVDQIDTPLVRGGVIEAERLRLDAEFLVSTGYIELFKVRIAVENFLMVRDAIVLDPGAGVVEAVGETADMSFPVANQEIEVVRTVPLRKIGRIRCGLGENGEWKGCDDKKQWQADQLAHFHSVRPFNDDADHVTYGRKRGLCNH